MQSLKRDGENATYSFKTYEPGSLTYEDIGDCGWGAFDVLRERGPMPANMPVLLVIGQQKAGTSWLYDVLKQHPAIVRARDYREAEHQTADGYLKELHWLDRTSSKDSEWETQSTKEYLSHFVDAKRKKLANNRATLIDITPSYLASYAAPARAKAVMPHARIVVILRDPIARMLSAFRMWRWRCSTEHADRWSNCPLPRLDVWLAKLVHEARTDPDSMCFFGGAKGPPVDWMECICSHQGSERPFWHSMFSGGAPDNLNTHRHMMSSNAAPQLAWWLAFFPPEQFLILTSDELRNPKRAGKAVERVLEHAGIRKAAPVTEEMLSSAHGLRGRRFDLGKEEPDVSGLMPALEKLFSGPEQELVQLIQEHWPDMNFTGVPHESIREELRVRPM